ncbi:DUF1972 domain-containing protein [Thalassobellus suaedae]|uniref:DUF1972 domain-containing protein n=1 Tax=Thalassobellus suaedae TaxID=3074124 RepID=A0ABY9XRZ3_9FLAO|nr:DUF1972 domain-containing protein [Flavobacteriaceae bacterium HL-DH14]
MKIGILGTRGIPNHHGGFEQFAEYFSVFLAKEEHDVFVYNSNTHPYKENRYKGVNIIHCKDPEDKIGTVGQFLYDLNCILDSRKRQFDVILQLGYTSSSIFNKLLPKSSKIVTNMDGLEWKRSKYSKMVQKFLLYAERLAIKSSDFLVSDSVGIQEYIKSKYNTDSKYIAYGADVFFNPQPKVLKKYSLETFKYNMLIARLEPENNIEVILDGVKASYNNKPFLVVGKHDTNKFGNYLKEKYKGNDYIKFVGGIYDLEILNNLRFFSNLYFHGHSVGGTNPSLLEAMASNSLVVANNNVFNKSILQKDAFYFDTAEDVTKYVNYLNKRDHTEFLERNIKKIEKRFNWDLINKEYLTFIKEINKKT